MVKYWMVSSFLVPKKYRLQEGERVEIYNALKVDPKDNRKKRAL